MRYSTSDLSRKSGDIIARALQGPVTITQRGKPRLILMSVEEYNRLRGKSGKTSAFGSPVEFSAGPYDPTPEKT
jgi:prevent-host-death family protein